MLNLFVYSMVNLAGLTRVVKVWKGCSIPKKHGETTDEESVIAGYGEKSVEPQTGTIDGNETKKFGACRYVHVQLMYGMYRGSNSHTVLI